jgi:hypothetical protein
VQLGVCTPADIDVVTGVAPDTDQLIFMETLVAMAEVAAAHDGGVGGCALYSKIRTYTALLEAVYVNRLCVGMVFEGDGWGGGGLEGGRDCDAVRCGSIQANTILKLIRLIPGMFLAHLASTPLTLTLARIPIPNHLSSHHTSIARTTHAHTGAVMI